MHFSAREMVDRKENHLPGEMQDDWKKQIVESERQKLSTLILQTPPKSVEPRSWDFGTQAGNVAIKQNSLRGNSHDITYKHFRTAD